MNNSQRQQFERLAHRLNELDANLGDPQVASDMKRFRELSREHAEVTRVVERYRRFVQREQDVAQAQDLLQDADMADLAQKEINEATTEMAQLQAELQAEPDAPADLRQQRRTDPRS